MSQEDVFVVVETQLSRFGLSPLAAARKLGFRTVFVARDPGRYVAKSGGSGPAELADRVVQADTRDAAAVVAAVRSAADTATVRGLCTFTDYSVEVVAEAARQLGLPGLSPQAAHRARNKLATRTACARAGVPGPRFAWTVTEEAAVSAADGIGYPCVVKPVTEAGSIGVRLCRSAAEVREHFLDLTSDGHDFRGQAKPVGALIEEYLIGYEVSVESVLAGGRRRTIGVVDKVLGGHPHFVELGESFPSMLPEPVTRGATEAAEAALDAIGHDFGAAHVELKMTAAGARLVEVNARPAGAEITRLILDATGIDLPLQVVRLHAGLHAEVDQRWHRAAASRYITAGATGALRAVHGAELARRVADSVEVELEAVAGDQVRSPTSNMDVIGQVVAVGDSAVEAVRLSDAALGQIQIEVLP
ncbi:ATP-grasp domain-containing protein [Streptomyces sp. B-S-A8]|uniref:ATP-grasp domain-containing protein n=1 Tax=Streptomyces solicavernae TaxID=3043614 RepID=A0ABT6RY27_9ACTN|nr:ATP-grasp domain-containing protein [Streptomyces sp. B-S-A8]MDI3389344.1 ATP-grasp domain-containing protein [Streptomyces sp. B-S-A8]